MSFLQLSACGCHRSTPPAARKPRSECPSPAAGWGAERRRLQRLAPGDRPLHHEMSASSVSALSLFAVLVHFSAWSRPHGLVGMSRCSAVVCAGARLPHLTPHRSMTLLFKQGDAAGVEGSDRGSQTSNVNVVGRAPLALSLAVASLGIDRDEGQGREHFGRRCLGGCVGASPRDVARIRRTACKPRAAPRGDTRPLSGRHRCLFPLRSTQVLCFVPPDFALRKGNSNHV